MGFNTTTVASADPTDSGEGELGFNFFAAEARSTHTGPNQQKSGSGGVDWDMPPCDCLPTIRPSRATDPRRGPTAAPLAVPRPNSPSTHRPPCAEAVPALRPRRPHTTPPLPTSPAFPPCARSTLVAHSEPS